jgi:hypothetical protein
MSSKRLCPNCGSEIFKIKSVSRPKESINQVGRQQFELTVDYEDIVSYNVETGCYDCKACGYSITFKEMTLQQRDAPLVKVSKKGVMQTKLLEVLEL